MQVRDLPVEKIQVGMRVKSLVSDRLGTIDRIDVEDDSYAWILWDGDAQASSGFYGNNCDCEVVSPPEEEPVDGCSWTGATSCYGCSACYPSEESVEETE
jgi:hypothetical protein